MILKKNMIIKMFWRQWHLCHHNHLSWNATGAPSIEPHMWPLVKCFCLFLWPIFKTNLLILSLALSWKFHENAGTTKIRMFLQKAFKHKGSEFSSINPQKDKSTEEKTRNMFYKNFHQKEIDNTSLAPNFLEELVRKLS